jgi:hypothetical protein
VSEKLARNDIDNLGETRTARNRSVLRLQMQLWPCDSTRSGTIEANRSPKRRFRLKSFMRPCIHSSTPLICVLSTALMSPNGCLGNLHIPNGVPGSAQPSHDGSVRNRKKYSKTNRPVAAA